MKKIVLQVCGAVFLASLFISCASSNRLEGYLYYRLNANPSTLDPALIVDVTGGLISAKLFNGLVRLDKDFSVISDIAEKWSVSSDGLRYRFLLRKGVRFSNNQEVRAGDFKYSFQRVLDRHTRSPNTWVLEKIAGARDFMEGHLNEVTGLAVLDDYTLEIRLEAPFSPFLYLLTMPAAYVVPEAEVIKAGKDFSSCPVGTGPFVLKRWAQNRELQVERREGYFDKKAEVRGIVYRVISEDLTSLTEFELGNIDVFSIPSNATSRFRNDGKWKDYVSSSGGVNTYYLGMNCSRPPFDNPALRRALSYAIDRRKLLETFYEERGTFAAGPVPDLLRRWPAPVPYDYDPAEAREIIRSEGFSGRVLHLFITADQEVLDMAEVIQFYLKAAGFDLRIRQLEWSAYKEAINRGEPDLFWLSWWADYPDPEDFLFPLFHSANQGPAGNRTRYSNPEVDRLIERAQTERNVQRRNLYYEKAEQQIVRDAPWVFFWHKKDFIARQPWVEHYETYPIYSMDKGTEIRIRNPLQEKAGW